MTRSTIKSSTAPGARGVGVYQRNSPGKPPSRIQILRSTYSSTKADGKTFGRTSNSYLLSVASGTPFLVPDDESKLRSLCLTDDEILQVNSKLAGLVEPARAHAASYRLEAVSQCAKRLATLVAENTDCEAMALDVLRGCFAASPNLNAVHGAEPSRRDSPGSPPVSRKLENPLGAAAAILDEACIALVAEAKQHRDVGLRLTNQRSIETTAPPTANALDRLQASANRIRRELLPAFEQACKAAGLMVSKSGS